MLVRNDVYYFRKLISNVSISDDGCWNWTGAVNGDGYSASCKDGKQVAGHIMMMQLTGQHVDGLVVDHICRNRKCINPDHLRMVTTTDNVLSNSVGPAAKNYVKTLCYRGHLFDEKNTKFILNGRGRTERVCRQCKREDAARRRAKMGKVLNNLRTPKNIHDFGIEERDL